ncbi:MAG: hypothetical protein ACRDFS_12315 [Chloroflexota bacterium]
MLDKALRHRKRVREPVQQQISKFERGADDDVGAVELASHEAPRVTPINQTIAPVLFDAV